MQGPEVQSTVATSRPYPFPWTGRGVGSAEGSLRAGCRVCVRVYGECGRKTQRVLRSILVGGTERELLCIEGPRRDFRSIFSPPSPVFVESLVTSG